MAETVAPAASVTTHVRGPLPEPASGQPSDPLRSRTLFVVANDRATTFGGWLEENRAAVEGHLAQSGAVLFRGFHMTSVAAFGGVSQQLCGDVWTDNAEHTPVSRDGAVQTPVPYAADRLLLWHNENSFNDEWPLRIAFCCVRPADVGGETPIVDSCLVYRHINPDLRRCFVDKGVAYIRNFGAGIGLDWRTIFRTDDRAEVDRHCREHGILAEWSPNGGLRTTAVRPAATAHPVTGELSWFNQAQHWHPSCLDSDLRGALQSSLGSADLPRDCTFGDGTRIHDDEMRHVLDVYRRHQVVFAWQQGDVLVLDNVLWAHGRNPYVGRRTMLVAMGTRRQYPPVTSRHADDHRNG